MNSLAKQDYGAIRLFLSIMHTGPGHRKDINSAHRTLSHKYSYSKLTARRTLTSMQQLQVNAHRTLSHQCSYCKFTTRKTHIALEGIDDELEVLGVDTLNAFLYNMVPVLVFHALQDVAFQFLHHLHL